MAHAGAAAHVPCAGLHTLEPPFSDPLPLTSGSWQLAQLGARRLVPAEADGWNGVKMTASVEPELAGSPIREHRPGLVVVVGPAVAAILRDADETGHDVVVPTGGARRCRAGSAALRVVPVVRTSLEA